MIVFGGIMVVCLSLVICHGMDVARRNRKW